MVAGTPASRGARTVELDTRRSITPAGVNAARQSLVIGTTGVS